MKFLKTKILPGFLLMFLAFFLKAEEGHQLWLRAKSTVPVKVECKTRSATLDIAVNELQQGWQGKAGATVTLTVKPEKLIKGDGLQNQRK